MNTLQINCFLETARCLNFSKAASNLYISQPTLSRNIFLLEKELQMKLFVRSSFQGTQLTEAGARMLAAFRQTKEIIEEAIDQAHDLESQKTYTLVLGLLEGQMVDERLCAFLDEFQQKYSNIHLEIVRESFHLLNAQLISDEIDIVLTLACELTDKSGIYTFPFYDLPTYLVVPRKYSKNYRDGEIYSLAEFSQLPFICTNKSDSPVIIDMLYKACREAGFEPQIRFVGSLNEETLLLERGMGIAGFNLYHSICHSPNVTCVRVKEFVPQRFSIGWKACSPNPAIAFFYAFFMDWHKNNESTD